MADQREYLPPTQSQKTNIFSGAMPNFRTSASLVEIATKCFSICASSIAASRNHLRAVCALVIVSCVVKVFDAIMKSVVSGERPFSVSAICVPSMFETKCVLICGLRYGTSASVTMTGPRSEPPMPMFTISVIDLLV